MLWGTQSPDAGDAAARQVPRCLHQGHRVCIPCSATSVPAAVDLGDTCKGQGGWEFTVAVTRSEPHALGLSQSLSCPRAMGLSGGEQAGLCPHVPCGEGQWDCLLPPCGCCFRLGNAGGCDQLFPWPPQVGPPSVLGVGGSPLTCTACGEGGITPGLPKDQSTGTNTMQSP